MRPDGAPDDDPLEQDAAAPPVDDPAIAAWFLGDGERANPATESRARPCAQRSGLRLDELLTNGENNADKGVFSGVG